MPRMAFSADSHAHLFTQLTRKGRRSPSEDEFATASSFDAARDAIHSTAQLGEHTNTTQQPLPSYHHQAYEYNQSPNNISPRSSQGSAEMSIELGRGFKRQTRDRDFDSPGAIVFNAGNGSLYEVTCTPPNRPRDTSRKTDDGMKKQASSQRATNPAKPAEPVKRTASMKQPSLSAAFKQIGAEDNGSFVAEDTTNTFNARNTRFTRSRQTSAMESAVPSRIASAPAQQTARAGANNTTTQSNSFLIPHVSNVNLNDVVSGKRKDGTPASTREARARTRPESGTYKPSRQDHGPLDRVLPAEEEIAIYASIRLAKDRADQLEQQLSETQKRVEEYESEVMDLRSQLTVIQRRPDSALGSDEDITGHDAWKKEKKTLQASVQALQDRFDRSERKISVSEITVKRVTKERDELSAQVGAAYHKVEELKSENEAFRESHDTLQAENQELKDEVDALRKENQELHLLMEQMQASYEQDEIQRDQREAQLRAQVARKLHTARDVRELARELRETKDQTQATQASMMNGGKEQMAPRQYGRKERPKSAGDVDEVMNNDLARKIAQEVRKQREATAAKRPDRPKSAGRVDEVVDDNLTKEIANNMRNNREAAARRQAPSASQTSIPEQPTFARPSTKSGSRFQSVGSERKISTHQRATSAPMETNFSDAESTTQLHFPPQSISIPKRPTPQTTARPRSALPKSLEEDERDLTMLSWQDPDEVAKLRKKLEEEYRSGKLKKANPDFGGNDDTQQTSQSFKQLQEDLLSGKLRNDIIAERKQEVAQQAAQSLPRKSSMKDVTNKINDGTGRLTMTGDNFAKVVKSVRVQSPHTSDEWPVNAPQQSEQGDTSTLSNTSRRRRRAANIEAMTSEFILPDVTISSFHSVSQAGTGIIHDNENCSRCPTTEEKEIRIPAPVPVTDVEDPDVTTATIRPSQPPALALATVIKQLEDEITHLKYSLGAQQRLYNQHNPSLSKRRRMDVKLMMDKFTGEIEKRSDQVYALYDVLEGQKEAAALAKRFGVEPKMMNEQDVEDTLSSLGIDPVELSGRIGRGAEDEEMAWERLSEVGSE